MLIDESLLDKDATVLYELDDKQGEELLEMWALGEGKPYMSESGDKYFANDNKLDEMRAEMKRRGYKLKEFHDDSDIEDTVEGDFNATAYIYTEVVPDSFEVFYKKSGIITVRDALLALSYMTMIDNLQYGFGEDVVIVNKTACKTH
jgi:hypothetical protein